MIFAVVGPSGAGKDTLIAGALRARPGLRLARRVITRPTEAGGEDFEGVTPTEFAARKARSEFALDWEAHGLSYGIPRGQVQGDGDVIFNGSRAALSAAQAVFPDLRVIVVTAPPDVLAARLAARGRETPDDIAERLDRAGFDLPAGIQAATVMNDSTPEQGVARLLAALDAAATTTQDPPMTETILANARLVLPDETISGQIRMVDGHIADIAQGTQVPAGAIDCEGDLVMPGLIELHTDNLERHLQPRPKVHWPHGAAIIAHDAELAGVGITTVFDALRVGSVVSDADANYGEYARALATEIMQLRAQGALRISHFLHLRAEVCSETLIAEMAKFGPEDRVGIVSLMDHTPGERQFRDLSKLRDYYTGKYAMSDEAFEAHVLHMTALKERVGARHEATVVSEARRYGATLASHDDTTAGQVAVSAGHGVHFAEFPTTAEAARACKDHGILVMMGAPNLIRGGSHSGNVAAADLAAEGLLDILSSDYVPSSLLTAALMLGDIWGNTARGIASVTSAPAQATDLHDRGRLEIGARADAIRVTRIGTAGAVRGVWVQGRRV